MNGKHKLKNTNIFIGEDFSYQTREIRRKLTRHLKDIKQKGDSRVAMIYDYLIIDGQKFCLDEKDNLVKK